MRSLPRILLLAAYVVAAASCASMLLLLARTLRLPSPIWGEWETVFAAQRIRAGLTLYVDPVVGAFDYGPVSSHTTVSYPPLASAVFAAFPDPAIGGKLLSAAIWFGALFGGALAGRRQNLPWSLFIAALLAGTWSTTVWGMSARPDAMAVGLVGVALVLITRQNRVGVLAAILLVVGACVKPTVGGVLVGAFAGQLLLQPRLAIRPLAAAAATLAVVGGTLWVASHGMFLHDMALIHAGSLDAGLLASSAVESGPFFMMPLVLVGVSLARQISGARLLVAAFVGCLACLAFCLTRVGRASNYYMELCVVLAVLAGSVPITMRRPAVWAALALVQSVWNGVATLHDARADLDNRLAEEALVERARVSCKPSADRVVLSDDPGIELAADGRIVNHLFFPVLNGHISEQTLVTLVNRPQIVCFAEHTHLLRAFPEVWASIERRFVTEEEGEYRLYRLR